MSKSSTSFKIETGVPVRRKSGPTNTPGPINAALLKMQPGQSLYPATKNQSTNAYLFANKRGFRISCCEENGAYRIHKIASTR